MLMCVRSLIGEMGSEAHFPVQVGVPMRRARTSLAIADVGGRRKGKLSVVDREQVQTVTRVWLESREITRRGKRSPAAGRGRLCVVFISDTRSGPAYRPC